MSDTKIKIQNSRGVSLFLAVFIMSVLLAISFGISGILIGQIKTMSEIGYSVVAFYAADSGIENVLMDRESPSYIPETTLPNGATYEVFVAEEDTENCSDDLNYCIKSIGSYQKTKRAIEIQY